MSAKPTVKKAALPVHGRLRRLIPSAILPAGPSLRGFSAEEMQRLRRRLSEALEVVVDPTFTPQRAERAVLAPQLTADALLTTAPARALRGDADLNESRTTLRVRAMTAAEERVAFLRYNYARYRMWLVLRKFAAKRLTSAATREILRWDEIATETRELIAQANLGLVPTMIERSRIRGVDFGDLISEGHLALLRSIEKFDCSRGFKFSTYACRSILTAITRAVALMARHRARFPAEFDPDMQKSDFVEQQRSMIEADCLDELRTIVKANTAELTRIEKRVLAERFGIGRRGEPDDGQKTLREVAELFGVTKERVRQIQNRALEKIRTRLDERMLSA